MANEKNAIDVKVSSPAIEAYLERAAGAARMRDIIRLINRWKEWLMMPSTIVKDTEYKKFSISSWQRNGAPRRSFFIQLYAELRETGFACTIDGDWFCMSLRQTEPVLPPVCAKYVKESPLLDKKLEMLVTIHKLSDNEHLRYPCTAFYAICLLFGKESMFRPVLDDLRIETDWPPLRNINEIIWHLERIHDVTEECPQMNQEYHVNHVILSVYDWIRHFKAVCKSSCSAPTALVELTQ